MEVRRWGGLESRRYESDEMGRVKVKKIRR